MNVGPDEARRVLIKLLTVPGEVSVFQGFDDISATEKNMLVVTCCATLIAHNICRHAGFREKDALAGLQSLNIPKLIRLICAKVN